MVLVLVCFSLALLALASWAISRKALFPSLAFNLAWVFALTIIFSRGAMFYRLADTTLALILLAASCFTVGSLLGSSLPMRVSKVHRPRQKLISALVWLIALVLPMFVMWLIRFTDGYQAATLLAAARLAFLNADKSMQFFLLSNLCYFSIPIAMVAVLENVEHKKRAAVAFTVSFILNALTGARAGLVLLTLSCFALSWAKNGRMPKRILSFTAASFVLIFGVITILSGRGNASIDNSSFAETSIAAADVFTLYVGGSIVAFDRVVRDQWATEHNEQITTPAAKVLNMFGARIEPPPDLGPGYVHWVNVGPNHLSTNTYTMLFPYYDWGAAGLAFLSMFVGAISGWIFRLAINGSRIGMMVYGMLFSFIILSIFADYFFSSFAFILRVLVISAFCYRKPSTRTLSLETRSHHSA